MASPPNRPADPIPASWRPILAVIVDRLVAKDYAGLARDGFVSYTSDPLDTSIGTWIEEYPASLVSLPEEAWAYAERGRITEATDTWWVILDLWTEEEGRSDLSMEATVEVHDDQLRITIDNVHVM